MMTPFRILAPAAEEVRQAIHWYEQRAAGLGVDFAVEFRRTLRRIREMPETPPFISTNARRLRLHRFPYGVIYYIEEGHVVIVAVMHLKRKPGYWMSRMPESN